MIPITYVMQNRVNSHRITLTGSGTLSDDGVMDMKISLDKMPVNWNPVIVPCICSGPGPGPNRPTLLETGGLIKYAPHGYRTSTGKFRKAVLVDAHSKVIASIKAAIDTSKSHYSPTTESNTRKKDSVIKKASQISGKIENSIDHGASQYIPINDSLISKLTECIPNKNCLISLQAREMDIKFITELAQKLTLLGYKDVGIKRMEDVVADGKATFLTCNSANSVCVIRIGTKHFLKLYNSVEPPI